MRGKVKSLAVGVAVACVQVAAVLPHTAEAEAGRSARLNVAVFGDSITWGQGLRTRQKFWTLYGKDLEEATGRDVSVVNYAHSGSPFSYEHEPYTSFVIPGGCEETPMEVPYLPSSVNECQIPAAARSGLRFDLVIMQGCGNDVGSVPFAAPDYRADTTVSTGTAPIDESVRRYCVPVLRDALQQAHRLEGEPKVVYLGYFPAVTEQSYLGPLRAVLQGFYSNATVRSYLSNLAQRATRFDREIDEVGRAETRRAGSWARFVDSGLEDDNALFASHDQLFHGVDDPKFVSRFRLCNRYVPRDDSAIAGCYVASIFHPNARGHQTMRRSLDADAELRRWTKVWSRQAEAASASAGLRARVAPASTACGTPLAAGDRTVQLTSQGRDRPFLLYVPKGYDGRTPVPLVLNLHGTLSDGPGQMDISGLRGYADRDGFLVAAPTGGARSAIGASWVVPGTPPRGEAPPGGYPDDVRYLSDVIARVQSMSCQDPARVIATGYSGGGRMTSALACDLATRVAGVVVDAGLRAGAPRIGSDGQPEPDPATCTPARPLPVVAVHGTADTVNPYEGGGEADWQYSVPTAYARWEKLLHCTAAETTTPFSSKIDLLEGTGCDTRLELYRVTGGGHQWFGGDPTKNPLSGALGEDPRQIDTSALVATMVRTARLRAPKASLRLTCRSRHRVRVRVSARTDSPLTSLIARVNGRRLVRTARLTASRTTRTGRRGRVRATATVTDAAGLTATVRRHKRCR